MRCYTGVGSRSTPKDICDLLTRIATAFCQAGWTLRSGAAKGADSAFEQGVFNHALKQIFLPWPSFEGRETPFSSPDVRAFDIAAELHPRWKSLSPAARKLHARNAHQVLGPNLDDPSLVLVCWTPDGLLKGGTSTAIRIAKKHDIPAFNLGAKKGLDFFRDWWRVQMSPPRQP